jgi:hypothetical protein
MGTSLNVDRFSNAVGPAELAMMQGVLDRFCADRGIEAATVEHHELASLLFAYFQRGDKTPEALLRRLESHQRKTK